jgi:hypothetical protein
MRELELARALKGIIMEAEHKETVVEKAVAYVKEMFGAPQYHTQVDSEGRPVTPPTTAEVGLTSDDAMGLEPHAHTFKTVGEIYTENARRDDTKDALSPRERHPDVIAPGL